MYEHYEKARDKKGLKNADVAKATGIPKQLFSDWKKRDSTPKAETLLKIADFLDVSVEYLVSGREPEPNNYYLDPEVAQMAQEIHDNEDLRLLFDTTRNVTKEDLQIVIDITKKLFRTE